MGSIARRPFNTPPNQATRGAEKRENMKQRLRTFISAFVDSFSMANAAQAFDRPRIDYAFICRAASELAKVSTRDKTATEGQTRLVLA